MPEGVGYSEVASKRDAAQTQRVVARAEQDKIAQTKEQSRAEPVSKKSNPAVEVKLSDEAIRAAEGVEPRQDADTYAALNRQR